MINSIFNYLTAAGKNKQNINKITFFLKVFIIFVLIISFLPYKPLENLSLQFLSNISLFIFFSHNQDLILQLESICLLFETFIIMIFSISHAFNASYYLYISLLEHILTIQFYYITISQLLYNLKIISFNSLAMFRFNGGTIDVICSVMYVFNYIITIFLIIGVLFKKKY